MNGDGGFQLNIQDLETVRRLNLPVKYFILCNGNYASIIHSQRNHFEGGRSVATRQPPDTARCPKGRRGLWHSNRGNQKSRQHPAEVLGARDAWPDCLRRAYFDRTR